LILFGFVSSLSIYSEATALRMKVYGSHSTNNSALSAIVCFFYCQFLNLAGVFFRQGLLIGPENIKFDLDKEARN
jgi:hypothetical protein